MKFYTYFPSRDTFAKEHIARYACASKYVEGKLVLDIACGVGYGSHFLMQEGAKEVVGGDVDRATICQTSYYKEKPLHFMMIDATHLPFKDECFGMIVSMETLEHVPKPRAFLKECKRCLEKEGVFILTTPNKDVESPDSSGTSHFYHTFEFSVNDIKQFVGQYFAECKLFGQDKNLLFGSISRVLRPLVLWAPNISKLIEFCSKFLFSDYGHAELGKTTMHALVDERFKPYPLNAGSSPAHIIVVAKKP